MTPATKLLHQQWKSLQVFSRFSPIRFMSATESILKRNELFDEEKVRQKDSIGRIEKIEVRYLGLPEDVTLMMNRGISTPYNCAQHLTEGHCKRSALALIDGNMPWDMYRPLKESCTLQLLNFTVTDPHLGILEKLFLYTRCGIAGELQRTSRPPTSQFSRTKQYDCVIEVDIRPLLLYSVLERWSNIVKSGSFVHDIYLSAQGWVPSNNELRSISAEMVKLAAKDIAIERVDVNSELANHMFADNRYKKEQLPSILSQNQGRVTLYRVGQHIDISRGPMISSTRFLGKCTVAAVHEVAKEGQNGSIYRVQGVALPSGIIINHFAYGILEKRARKINSARLPNEPFEEQTAEQLIA